MARSYETATRIEIPRIKHAPTSLTTNLEEYLNDKDFEINRRQYLAQQEAKRSGKPVPSPTKQLAESKNTTSKSVFPDVMPVQSGSASQPTPFKGPSADLIDFFESIEQNQQPMASNSNQFHQQAFQPQFTNFPQQGQSQQTSYGVFQQQPQAQQPINQQSTNPFSQFQQTPQQEPPQVQTQPTGAGFGGYTNPPQQQQTQPQQTVSSSFGHVDAFAQTPQQYGVASQQPPQQPPHQQMPPQLTNPFRQSMMPQVTGLQQAAFQPSPPPPLPQMNQPTGTNPFAQNSLSQQSLGASQPTQPSNNPPYQHPQQSSSLVPQRTGTNPFARASPASSGSPSQPSGAFVAQATGTTNPFRQSAFVNQQTGVGWQTQQGTMGGLEDLETKPVFPRPGQPPQSQQSSWL